MDPMTWLTVGLVVAIAAVAFITFRRLIAADAGHLPGPPALEARARTILAGPSPAPDAYRDLFRYFVEGFVRHQREDGSGAKFPGWPSFNGRARDEMEAFTRLAPLVASWLRHGRPARCELSDGHMVDLEELLRRGVRAGTDPRSPGYWRPIGDRDQRIVEAADVALALWLSKAQIWSTLETEERERIHAWLKGVRGRRTADNNWHLFVVLVDAVLVDLGFEHDPAQMSERYLQFKRFYRGDGWFSDGPEAKFDYYNAWGIHYPLFWLQQIRPDWDAAFLSEARSAFAKTFKHFFGPWGFPIMGRSVCYRLAAPAPLVQIQLTEPDSVSPGEARRALDLTWRFFGARGALRGGTVTQGYCSADPRLLDNYSGPGSCLWSLRSLVAAFYVSDQSAFWMSSGDPLPVERSDFRIAVPSTGWTLSGDRASGDVVLHLGGARTASAPALESYPVHRRLVDRLLGRARRPSNTAAKYQGGQYGSKAPFCGSGDGVPSQPR